MYERPHHGRIAQILLSLNRQILIDNECYFGGGTAITLMLNEYRESLGVNFICASQHGYRALRQCIGNWSLSGLDALFEKPIELMREVRADRYGIRAVLSIDNQPIKFEIVREDRIDKSDTSVMGVPILSKTDLFAEKLLANADRYNDISSQYRDLAFMVHEWGEIPEAAFEKAGSAYGDSAINALNLASRNLLASEGVLEKCLHHLQVEEKNYSICRDGFDIIQRQLYDLEADRTDDDYEMEP